MYPPGMPSQPPPVLPTAAGGGINIMSQFAGSSLWSNILGLISIVVPFVFNRVFFFLPLIGLFYAIRAIRNGQLIGGIVGIVLNCIGGLVTLVALYVH